MRDVPEEETMQLEDDAPVTEVRAAESGEQAETGDVPEQRRKKEKSGLGAYRWAAVSGTVLACIVLAAMLINITSAFGDAVSVITIFEFFFSIFYIRSGIVYITLAKFSLAIFYIVILVMTIKDIVFFPKTLYGIFRLKGGEKSVKRAESIMNYICGSASSIAARFYAFLIAAYALSGDPLTFGSWIVIGAGAVYALLMAVCSAVRSEKPLADARDDCPKSYAASLVLRQILLVFCIGVLAFVMSAPSGYDLAFGVQVLFGGYFQGVSGFFITLYHSIVKHILNIVALFMMIRMIGIVWSGYNVSDGAQEWAEDSLANSLQRILSVMAVGAVLAFVFSAFEISGECHFGSNTFSIWWNTIQFDIFPTIVAVIAGMLIVYFLHEDKPNKKKTSAIVALYRDLQRRRERERLP